MSEQQGSRVLIVGAGSMGIVTGYVLSLAGAEVTFLIRPHRAEALNHTQTLYCYNDNQVKQYKDYKYVTDPSKIVGVGYDYILITLDGAALKNEVGTSLVKTIGEAARGTQAKVLIGSYGFELRPWFLQVSGLPSEQVASAILAIHAYSPLAVTLPVHAPTDEKLVATADLAYADSLGPGFIVDDSSPAVAKAFSDLYNASGVSTCVVMPAAELALMGAPAFPIFAACELTGWPKFKDIATTGEPWSLAVAAGKEVSRLSVFGEAGKQAAAATTEDALVAQFAGMEQAMLPLDFQAFNRYHHGGKVNGQDRELLRDWLSFGEAEGNAMPALKELIRRVSP